MRQGPARLPSDPKKRAAKHFTEPCYLLSKRRSATQWRFGAKRILTIHVQGVISRGLIHVSLCICLTCLVVLDARHGRVGPISPLVQIILLVQHHTRTSRTINVNRESKRNLARLVQNSPFDTFTNFEGSVKLSPVACATTCSSVF